MRLPLAPRTDRIGCIHRSGPAAGVLLATLLLLLGAPLRATGQWYEMDVHDPVMIEADGTYYLFHTGRGIAVWSSPGRANWTRLEGVFEEAPAWTDEVVPDFRNYMWAPDVVHHDGTYYLYYSVSSFGENTSAIGVATSPTLDPTDPDFEWTDHGPVVRSVPGRDLWNAIDPSVGFDEEGRPWMAFGSYWTGIKLVRLTDDLLSTDSGPESWYTIAARERSWTTDPRDAGAARIEAPFIFQKSGYYYLFVSWGICCRGEDSTYRVMVGRSDSITGPYLDRSGTPMDEGGGTLVVEGNERWPGVGHNSAYTFDGTDFLVFHGYDARDDGESKLWIREITWENGWPTVSLELDSE